MSVVRVPHATQIFDSIFPSFLGGGKKNYVATRDRTTDLGVKKKGILFNIETLEKKNLEIPPFCSKFFEKKNIF